VTTRALSELDDLAASVAERTAELLAERLDPRAVARAPLVDAATVAKHLSVSEKFVRAHATELGGRQLVPGGPWRFDLAVARGDVGMAMTQRATPAPRSGRPPRSRDDARVPLLLPIKG
jgi:hypothetical protein